MGNQSIDTTVSYFDGPIFYFLFFCINYPVIACNIILFTIFVLNMCMLRVSICSYFYEFPIRFWTGVVICVFHFIDSLVEDNKLPQMRCVVPTRLLTKTYDADHYLEKSGILLKQMQVHVYIGAWECLMKCQQHSMVVTQIFHRVH